MPKEIVFDYSNNLWIGYERDINDQYSPGGIKMVKINDISNNSDDQWYNKHKIEIVGCGNESIQHSIQDMSTITALPGIDYGTSGRTGTPEQLDNISVAFGMRKETITLNGIMIDRGVISAYNPRRQVILDIARSQYLKIRNTAPIPDVEEKKDDDKDNE